MPTGFDGGTFSRPLADDGASSDSRAWPSSARSAGPPGERESRRGMVTFRPSAPAAGTPDHEEPAEEPSMSDILDGEEIRWHAGTEDALCPVRELSDGSNNGFGGMLTDDELPRHDVTDDACWRAEVDPGGILEISLMRSALTVRSERLTSTHGVSPCMLTPSKICDVSSCGVAGWIMGVVCAYIVHTWAAGCSRVGETHEVTWGLRRSGARSGIITGTGGVRPAEEATTFAARPRDIPREGDAAQPPSMPPKGDTGLPRNRRGGDTRPTAGLRFVLCTGLSTGEACGDGCRGERSTSFGVRRPGEGRGKWHCRVCGGDASGLPVGSPGNLKTGEACKAAASTAWNSGARCGGDTSQAEMCPGRFASGDRLAHLDELLDPLKRSSSFSTGGE